MFGPNVAEENAWAVTKNDEPFWSIKKHEVEGPLKDMSVKFFVMAQAYFSATFGPFGPFDPRSRGFWVQQKT
jgi:hypothetical protein